MIKLQATTIDNSRIIYMLTYIIERKGFRKVSGIWIPSLCNYQLRIPVTVESRIPAKLPAKDPCHGGEPDPCEITS